MLSRFVLPCAAQTNSRLRNRVIGRVFKEVGLIEQWGSGVRRVFEACDAQGLPSPVFEDIGTHFRVTFPLATQRAPIVDAIDQQFIQTLAVEGGLRTFELASSVVLSPRRADATETAGR